MADRWILRKGSKQRGFQYVASNGEKPVRDAATLARVEALRIPPAWTDVHISPSARAAIQAWGFDGKGRKQYRYHDRAVERGTLRKYYRVRQLALDLPLVREAVARDFAGKTGGRRGTPALSRRRVSAGVVCLIEEGLFRVGNERYARENKTFGITTLLKRHVRADDDRVVFRYVGKRSIEQRQVVVGRRLASFVRELLRAPGRRLFRYVDEGGVWADLTARDVNAYLHELVGVPYTAKDFRTWGGTLRAATLLAELGPWETHVEAKRNIATVVRLVAAELGNTPAICRKSYIHPMVLARYEDEGVTIAPSLERQRRATTGRRSRRYAPEERALIEFLDKYFPERRRQRRDENQQQRARAA